MLVGTHPLADHGERTARGRHWLSVAGTGATPSSPCRPEQGEIARTGNAQTLRWSVTFRKLPRPSEAGIAKLLAPTGRRNGTPLGRTKGWAQAPQVSRSQPRKIIVLGPLRPGRSNGPPAKGRWGGVNKLDRDANELNMARKALAVALLPPCRRSPG